MRWYDKSVIDYRVGEKELLMQIEITETPKCWEIHIVHMLQMHENDQGIVIVHDEEFHKTGSNDIRHAKARAGALCHRLYERIQSGEIMDEIFGKDDEEDDEENGIK